MMATVSVAGRELRGLDTALLCKLVSSWRALCTTTLQRPILACMPVCRSDEPQYSRILEHECAMVHMVYTYGIHMMTFERQLGSPSKIMGRPG